MFSLKLPQISSQNCSGSDSNYQTKKEKQSPKKYQNGTADLLEQAMGIESFISAQRVALIETISKEGLVEELDMSYLDDCNIHVYDQDLVEEVSLLAN